MTVLPAAGDIGAQAAAIEVKVEPAARAKSPVTLTKPSSLAPVERMNLVADAWALFRAGAAPLAPALDLLFAFARDKDYVDANYAIHLPLVDMLMGTFRRPPRGSWPDEYGVMKLETVPRGFWAQAWMPLAPKKAYEDYVGRETP